MIAPEIVVNVQHIGQKRFGAAFLQFNALDLLCLLFGLLQLFGLLIGSTHAQNARQPQQKDDAYLTSPMKRPHIVIA